MKRKVKILYAVQATGNGHLIKAREIIPLLLKYGEVDILTSGNLSDIDLGYPIKYKLNGMSFVYNKKGGINYLGMLKNVNIINFLKEIKNVPVKEYDLVLNDYEPITAWACKRNKVPIISISHQVCFTSDKTPRTKIKNLFAEFIIKNYAPFSKDKVGFHFKPYDNFIYSPLIRKEIRESKPTNSGYYTVYLPSYSVDFLKEHLGKIKNTKWQIFSREVKAPFVENNMTFLPVELKSFTESFIKCKGILCGAGFETPSEAIYMGKKLFVIPIEGQYEQECNAAALEKMEIRTTKKINTETLNDIERWIAVDRYVKIEFPNLLPQIIDKAIRPYI